MALNRSLTVFMLLSSSWSLASQAQDLKAAYTGNQVFVLRDAVSQPTTSIFYKGAVASFANEITTAENDLGTVIKNHPHSDDAYEAHDLLGNMYFRNGKYRQGYREIVAAIQVRSGDSDARSMLSISTALNALPEMKILESKPGHIAIDADEIFLPLRANGQELSFFFDTGANISVIGESTAKELGLTLTNVGGKMGDASGQGVSGIQLALVSDLRIGGLHLQDVPFVVVSDSGEPWVHLPKSKHGIIGLPLLLAMRTIRWTPTGSFEEGFPSQAFSLQSCNMLFHNSNPVVDVLADEKHLDFTLDTGAVDTDLNPAFAKALPALMKSGTLEKQSIEGLGGKLEQASILLPSVPFVIGGKHVELRPAHVFTEHGNGTWAAGNLGMDLLKQAHAFTLDFAAMTLRLQ